MNVSFATLEFYGKAAFHILCPCIVFLKMVYKKECYNNVWFGQLYFQAPPGRAGVPSRVEVPQEGSRERAAASHGSCVCHEATSSWGGESSLFNFEIVFEIVAVY